MMFFCKDIGETKLCVLVLHAFALYPKKQLSSPVTSGQPTAVSFLNHDHALPFFPRLHEQQVSVSQSS